MENREILKLVFKERNEEINIIKEPNFTITKRNDNLAQVSFYYDNSVLIVFFENGKPSSYTVLPIKSVA